MQQRFWRPYGSLLERSASLRLPQQRDSTAGDCKKPSPKAVIPNLPASMPF
jgi:hypothetical protein